MTKVHVIGLFIEIWFEVHDGIKVACIEQQTGHVFMPGKEFEPIMNLVTVGETTYLTCVSAHLCERVER